MTPDFTKAATQAVRVLLKYGVDKVPVYPQQVLQKSQIVTMVSFADLAEMANVSRDNILSTIHADNDLAISFVHSMPDGSPRYVFAFNREKPIDQVSMAMAIELGHVYLGHVGYLDNETRLKEAKCFACHFMYPRAVIRLLQERGFVFTKKSFARVFGKVGLCIENVENPEPVIVHAELNRDAKELFVPYVDKLETEGMLSVPVGKDDEMLDVSKFMDGYED